MLFYYDSIIKKIVVTIVKIVHLINYIENSIFKDFV